MKNIINNPSKAKWTALCERPSFDTSSLNETVLDVIEKVKQNGDTALKLFREKFDGVPVSESFVFAKEDLEKSAKYIDVKLAAAIDLAYNNIYKFHAAQQFNEAEVETSKGVRCFRKAVAIEKVGLYIPGGSAPLFSTILMLAIPAQITKCDELILCHPVKSLAGLHPAVAYTVLKCGINQLFAIGGAQAVAAMAVGTESIPKVNKIFGPGNQYVTRAKELVSQMGTAIDMPAGPSELLVYANDSAVPEFVAADLLSQAEHGADSQVILVSTSEEMIQKVMVEITFQVTVLPRKEIALKALENSKSILFDGINDAWDFINEYAPEHLIVACDKAEDYIPRVKNAGSVFLGNYTPESAGDYASGTNHTLPTSGYAKMYSGVSLADFSKTITFQKLNADGVNSIGKAVELMAENEGLQAHKNAMTLRLASLK